MAVGNCLSLGSWAGIIRAKLQQDLHAGEWRVHCFVSCSAAQGMSQAPWSSFNSDLLPLCLYHPRGMMEKKTLSPSITPARLMENEHQMLNSMGTALPNAGLKFAAILPRYLEKSIKSGRYSFGDGNLEGAPLSR